MSSLQAAMSELKHLLKCSVAQRLACMCIRLLRRNSATGATSSVPGATAFSLIKHITWMSSRSRAAGRAFLATTGINDFSNFGLNRAKHFVPVTPAGHVIGDMIVFREREDTILVGRSLTANWLRFQAAYGNWNVRCPTIRARQQPDGERVMRAIMFQIQGPDAPKSFERMNGGPIPDIKFFHGLDQYRVEEGSGTAPWYGRGAGPGNLGPYVDKHYIRSTIMGRPAMSA